MPRIRTIKPELWQDEKLSALDPLTRLVFIGIISMADDAGRLVDNVKLIDGFLFPETDDSSRGPLESLAKLSRILRYVAPSGQRVIQIVHWKDHQRVDHPNPHVLPPPAEEDLAAARDARFPVIPRELLATASRAPRASTSTSTPTSTNDLHAAPERRGKPENGVSPSWVVEAVDLYGDAIGIIPHGRMGRALKPAVDRFGWPAIKPWLIAYCQWRPIQLPDGSYPASFAEAEKNTRFCSPEEFVKTLAAWREMCQPAKRT